MLRRKWEVVHVLRKGKTKKRKMEKQIKTDKSTMSLPTEFHSRGGEGGRQTHNNIQHIGGTHNNQVQISSLPQTIDSDKQQHKFQFRRKSLMCNLQCKKC